MRKHLLLAAAAAATFTAAPAFAQAFTGGAGTFVNLGDDGRDSGFDQIVLSPLAGTYTGPGTYDLNDVTFNVGINRDAAATVSGVLTGLTGTFNGGTFNYDVDYTIFVSTIDTITLGGNKFNVDGTTVLINPLTLTSGVGSTGGVLTVSTGSAVPEPATWAMMMLGFGMVGFGLRYSRKSTKVSFA
jgi:hypothetical protein